MDSKIKKCYDCRTGSRYCGLTRTNKGWGCKFLTTEIPMVDNELNVIQSETINKPKLFAQVYREAKEKGILECPAYRSIFIDKMLDNLSKLYPSISLN